LFGLSLSCGGSDEPPVKPKDPRILSFTAVPPVIEVGQAVTLRWETVGTAGVNIEPRVGLMDASGEATDMPLVNTVYTLSIPGGPSELTAQVTVMVTGGPPVINEFKATPRTISEGEPSLLEWRTTNADQVTIEPGLGTQQPEGSLSVMPRVTTTYRLIATRGAQTAPTQEVVVVVASGNQPMVKTFNATPQTIQAGEEVTLNWEATNATAVTIDNGIGAQPTTGEIKVRPTQTTIYTLTASGPGGSASAPVTVTVIPVGDPEITRFDATPMTIAPGGQAELNWDTNNASSVSIDNGIGARPAKGTEIVMPAATTTYTLTAFGNNIMVTQQITVTVAAPNDPVILTFEAQPSAILSGGTTTLSWTTQNVTGVDIDNGVGMNLSADGSITVMPATTTVYTITARGQNSTIMAMTTVTVNPAPPSIVTFAAQPASITSGSPTTLSWMTTNATSVTIDNGVGMQLANGSVSVSPTQTTLYTLTAVGPGGTVTAQVSVSVTLVGAPVIAAFSAMPQQINPGGQATLTWNVTDATAITIDNGIGTQPLSGTRQVSPAATTTYTLTADGPGGTTSAQVTITVLTIVGDRCTDAFVVTGSGGTFTGNTQQAVDDYSASSSCTGFNSSGPDVVYRVSLQQGDRVRASLQPSNTAWDSSLYFVTSCSAIAQSCVAGQDNGNPEEIDYTAAMAGDYFLIVDGFAGAGGTYSLTINITAAPIGNDQCTGAIDATTGGSFSGDTTNATDNYNPGAAGCTGYAAAANDVAYRVTLAAGERLQASLTAAWDASLYVVSDCAMPAATCLSGQDDGNPEQIDFTAISAGTYYIIVDGWGTARGTFSLDVNISPPVTGGDTCATAVSVPAGGGSFVSTTAGLMNDYNPPAAMCTGFAAQGADQAYRIDLGAGDVVEVLAQFDAALDGATYVVNNCASITSCIEGSDSGPAGTDEEMRFVAESAGAYYVIVDSFSSGTSGAHDLTIASYTGETCALAAPLRTDGVAELYTTMGRTNDYSPNSGGCTGFTAAAPDRAYSVGVQAGDQLQVSLDPDNYDASLYVVSNCADVSGSCVQGSDLSVSATEELYPVFQQSGTYFVIADGYSTANGRGMITSRIVRGDTCAGAYRVPARAGTFTFNGTTGGYGAELGTNNATGSCTGFTQDGRDAVYAVSLAANQQLTASVSAAWDAAIYVVSSCAASGTTCLAGQDNGNPEELTYTNGATATTVYVIVDSWRLGNATTVREGNYTLTVTLN
jgi:hypothetical protein